MNCIKPNVHETGYQHILSLSEWVCDMQSQHKFHECNWIQLITKGQIVLFIGIISWTLQQFKNGACGLTFKVKMLLGAKRGQSHMYENSPTNGDLTIRGPLQLFFLPGQKHKLILCCIPWLSSHATCKGVSKLPSNCLYMMLNCLYLMLNKTKISYE